MQFLQYWIGEKEILYFSLFSGVRSLISWHDNGVGYTDQKMKGKRVV